MGLRNSKFDIVVENFSSGNFLITDTKGKTMLTVKQCDTFFHRQRQVFDSDDEPVYLIRKKIRSVHNRWNVFEGESNSKADKIWTAKEAHAIQFKTDVLVFLGSKTNSKDVSDYNITGSWSNRNCTIYMGGETSPIAQMSKMDSSKGVKFVQDKFKVTIYQKVDYVLVVTLLAIVEAMKSSKKEDREFAARSLVKLISAVLC